MQETDFPEEFKEFVQAAVPTVRAAELLVELQRPPRRWCAPADAEASRLFGLFQAKGLVVARPDGWVRYCPANRSVEGHVRMLVLAYRERPVTLVRMVYALQEDRPV